MIRYFYLTHTKTCITSPGRSGPGSNGNEEVLHDSQSTKVVASPSNILDNRWVGGLTLRQRYSQHILLLQPTGLLLDT